MVISAYSTVPIRADRRARPRLPENRRGWQHQNGSRLVGGGNKGQFRQLDRDLRDFVGYGIIIELADLPLTFGAKADRKWGTDAARTCSVVQFFSRAIR